MVLQSTVGPLIPLTSNAMMCAFVFVSDVMVDDNVQIA
jgi:hypothetical protein